MPAACRVHTVFTVLRTAVFTVLGMRTSGAAMSPLAAQAHNVTGAPRHRQGGAGKNGQVRGIKQLMTPPLQARQRRGTFCVLHTQRRQGSWRDCQGAAREGNLQQAPLQMGLNGLHSPSPVSRSRMAPRMTA